MESMLLYHGFNLFSGLSNPLVLRDLSSLCNLSPKKVVDNSSVIEGQWMGKSLLIEDADFDSIISGQGISCCKSLKDDRYRVVPRIPCWFRIGPQLSNEFNIKASLLFCFSYGGLFQAFTIVHKAPGEGPSKGRIFSLNEHNSPGNPNNDINGGQGVAVRGHRLSAMGAFEGVHQ